MPKVSLRLSNEIITNGLSRRRAGLVIQPGKPQEFDVDDEQLQALLDDAFIEVTVLDETASEATEATETTTEPEVVEGEVETASNEGEAEVEETEAAEAADVEVPTPSSIKKQPREAVVAQAKELGIELDYENETAVTKQVMADAIVAALKAQKEAAEAAPEA
jgi:hypothetical protein|nr:MAG TPA: hypothetical protein [Caudoviricetes sp.]